jgi:uncharacterized caspase-like protein
MRIVMSAALALLLSLLAGCAEKRVALIIGEGNYPGGFWRHLNTPVNDAETIASKLLKAAGFRDEDVTVLPDKEAKSINNAIEEFGSKAAHARVAVFFYSGHGIQVPLKSEGGQINATDYLVPIDAPRVEPGTYKYDQPPIKLIDISRVIDAMGSAHTKLVFLDACRSRSPQGSQGLAQSAPVPDNTLIAYAAQAGGITGDSALTRVRRSDNTTEFRVEKNSPFTKALAAHIADENVDVQQMLNLVLRDAQTIPEVQESRKSSEFQYVQQVPTYADSTSLASRPASYSRLTHDFFLVHRHIPN